jgi:hypothetical protein
MVTTSSYLHGFSYGERMGRETDLDSKGKEWGEKLTWIQTHAWVNKIIFLGLSFQEEHFKPTIFILKKLK